MVSLKHLRAVIAIFVIVSILAVVNLLVYISQNLILKQICVEGKRKGKKVNSLSGELLPEVTKV